MKTISQGTLNAIDKSNPLEATIWRGWIARGEARIEEEKCHKTA